MASARVASAMAPCQASTGSWLATRVERSRAGSSTTSRRSRHWSTLAGVRSVLGWAAGLHANHRNEKEVAGVWAGVGRPDQRTCP